MRWLACIVLFVSGCAISDTYPNSPTYSRRYHPRYVTGLRPIDQREPWFESDSTTPHLAWETFPTDDIPAGDAKQMKDVTYDLRVYDIQFYDKKHLVYEREGIEAAQHVVEQHFERDWLYMWTVRARFKCRSETPAEMAWVFASDFFPRPPLPTRHSPNRHRRSSTGRCGPFAPTL